MEDPVRSWGTEPLRALDIFRPCSSSLRCKDETRASRSNNRLCGRCAAGAGDPEKSPMRASGTRFPSCAKLPVLTMERLRKKTAGKAREARGVRRTLAYAARTRDEAQRSIRAFFVAVIVQASSKASRMSSIAGPCGSSFTATTSNRARQWRRPFSDR